MARVTTEDCTTSIPNRFQLVIYACSRARELLGGTEPNVQKDNDKLSIDFSDIDTTLTETGKSEYVVAPKDLDTLEKRAQEIREKEAQEEENDKLDIGNDIDIDLDSINLGEPLSINDEIELDDIEQL